MSMLWVASTCCFVNESDDQYIPARPGPGLHVDLVNVGTPCQYTFDSVSCRISTVGMCARGCVNADFNTRKTKALDAALEPFGCSAGRCPGRYLWLP